MAELLIDIDALLNKVGLNVCNARIGVAVSGGRDSVALLHALWQGGANVVAINVEHGIRGQASLDDSAFVKDICDEWHIPLLQYFVDAPSFSKQNGYTLEQGARILRYSVFDNVLSAGRCDVIALAHHMDDQTETVLMRIFRGSGERGLVGMREISGRYIRPLLKYDRADIDAYIAKHGLKYREDATNYDDSYTRNFLRGEIARIKQRYPRLNDSIARLTKNVAEQEELLDSLTPKPYVMKGGKAYVYDGTNLLGDATVANVSNENISRVDSSKNNPDCALRSKAKNAVDAAIYQCDASPDLPPMKNGDAFLPVSDGTSVVLIKRGIMLAAASVGVRQDIEDRHYPLILDLLNAENGKRLNLPHDLVIYRVNGGLIFAVSSKNATPQPIGVLDPETERTKDFVIAPLDKIFGDPSQNDNATDPVMSPVDKKDDNCSSASAMARHDQCESEAPFGEGTFCKFGAKIRRIKKCEFSRFSISEKSEQTVDNPGNVNLFRRLYVNPENIPKNAVIRRRRDGDFIEKFGGGTKSLGDFLTDKKVPARFRDDLAVVAVGSEVLAIFGLEISRKCKVDENTEFVYELSVLPYKNAESSVDYAGTTD